MGKDLARVRGTVDKLTSDIALEEAVLTKIIHWLKLCNFAKVEAPILERIDLFVDSLGTQTDVVNKELFLVAGKNSSDESICLRPELTAGIFRAFLENQALIVRPWKVFAVGPCFRYERPQKGRLRQFDQISLEVIDAHSPIFDAEMLLVLDRIFSQKLQLTNYTLKLNYIGGAAERAIYREALQGFLVGHQAKLCADCQVRQHANPLRCLDCKNPLCNELFTQAPRILDVLDAQSQAIFEDIQDNLRYNSVNFIIDHRLVRGLDYYRGVVFEFMSQELGAQSTFCGGGRYELAQRLGEKQAVPCVGAGIGLARLCMLAKDNVAPGSQKLLIAILPFSSKEEALALIVADNLRKNNHCCEIILDKDSLKGKMRQASRLNAQKVIFIGEEEVARNTLTIKDLNTGEERVVLQEDLLKALQEHESVR